MNFENDFVRINSISGNYSNTFVYDTLISRLYEMRLTDRIVNRCYKRIEKENATTENEIKGIILEEFVWCNIVDILKPQGYRWSCRSQIYKIYC